MPFERGKPKTGGRQPGIPNALTGAFRDAVRHVYAGLGGHANFLAWTRDNQTEFYKFAARLIPGEMEGNGDKHITVIVNRRGATMLDARPALENHSQEGGCSKG